MAEVTFSQVLINIIILAAVSCIDILNTTMYR